MSVMLPILKNIIKLSKFLTYAVLISPVNFILSNEQSPSPAILEAGLKNTSRFESAFTCNEINRRSINTRKTESNN